MVSSSVMYSILQNIISFLVLLFAISIHESAHAWAADRFGDPTARIQGRITLNPLAHIDLIGTIIFPFFLILANRLTGARVPVFGWAKPVMVNPFNLRNPRRDGMYISAAGPLSNLVTGVVVIAILLVFQRAFLLSSSTTLHLFLQILIQLMIINVFLCIFNLIPIPPLDGSGILEGLLKGEVLRQYEKIKSFGFILLLFILWTGVFDRIAGFVFSALLRLFPTLTLLLFKAEVFS